MAVARHRRRREPALVGLGLAWALSACQPRDGEVDLPPVVWEGEHLAFGVSDQAGDYCAGTPAYLDGYVAGLVEILDRPPLAEKVRYSFLARDEVPDWESGVVGLSTDQGVLSGFAVHEHELAHAVLRPNGFTQPLLDEGLAEYLDGDGDSTFDNAFPLEEALAAVEHARLPGEYYGVAGSFIAYLDTSFGRDVVLELEARLGRWSSTNDFAAAFADASGVPFSAAVTGFESLDRCPHTTFREPSAACFGAATLAWCDGGEPASHRIDLVCGSPDVIGVRDDEIWTYRVVNIPAPGRYGIYIRFVEEPIKGYLELKQCAGGCESFRERIIIPTGIGVQPARWFDIEEPGDYILKLAVEQPDEVTVEFELLGVECQ